MNAPENNESTVTSVKLPLLAPTLLEIVRFVKTLRPTLPVRLVLLFCCKVNLSTALHNAVAALLFSPDELNNACPFEPTKIPLAILYLPIVPFQS